MTERVKGQQKINESKNFKGVCYAYETMPTEWMALVSTLGVQGKKYNKVRVGLLLYILEIAKLRKIQKRERKVKKEESTIGR